jgi:hypothetical protein
MCSDTNAVIRSCAGEPLSSKKGKCWNIEGPFKVIYLKNEIIEWWFSFKFYKVLTHSFWMMYNTYGQKFLFTLKIDSEKSDL